MTSWITSSLIVVGKPFFTEVRIGAPAAAKRGLPRRGTSG